MNETTRKLVEENYAAQRELGAIRILRWLNTSGYITPAHAMEAFDKIREIVHKELLSEQDD